MLKHKFNIRTVLLTLLAGSLMCASCGQQTLIDETHPLADNTWMRFEPEVFHFDISDIDACYNIYLTVCYDTTLVRMDKIPLVIDFYADSNELHNIMPTLHFTDRKGVRRGTLSGNYCTVTDTLDRYRFYNRAASYTYRIKQGTSRYELPGISSVSLKVEEADLSLKGV